MPGRAPARNAEFDLLLTCAAHDNSEKQERLRKLVFYDVDWENFLRIAKHHRLIPQAYRSLLEVKKVVSSEALQKLHRFQESNARQTLRLTRDLIRVLRHFASQDMAVLAYKGPALASVLDGDVTSRQYSDLDLLVCPSAVEKARAALIELGYTPHGTFTRRQEKSYVRSGYEYAFDLPDARNALELKWRIVPRFYAIDFDIDGFFDRSVTLQVAGHPVRTLCAEDLLLVLCVHAAKHAWQELSLLWDISRLTQSQRINWDAVMQQARCSGVQQLLAVSFQLTHDLVGAEVPDLVLRKIEGEQTTMLAQRVKPTLTESQEIDTESIAYFRLMLAARERWRDRARFLLRLAFIPGVSEWSAVQLPGWLFSLYYPIRICRLARRFVQSFMKRVSRRWSRFPYKRTNSGQRTAALSEPCCHPIRTTRP